MNQTLNKTQIQNFLKLVQAPLLDVDNGIPELVGADWEVLYRLARKHNVVSLGYEAVMRLPAEQRPDGELLKKWRMDREQCTLQCIYQQAALEEIIQVFEEERIPFVLLKGAVLRELYPRADLRSMSDLDILIREEDAKRAKTVVNGLGYRGNEDVYRRDVVTLELHRKLFRKNDIWNTYFDSIWKRAKPKSGYSYYFEMCPEDFYVHLLGHIIHHMQNGGIGVKAFFDSRIYLIHYKELWDEKYLLTVLNKLGLHRFYLKLQELVSCWFENQRYTSLMEEWTEFIVRSGAYGNFNNFVVMNPALKNTQSDFGRREKYHYLWKRLFPDYNELCNMFPQAKRGRFLYPVYAVKRILKNGLLRLDAVKQEMDGIKTMDGKRIQKLNKLYKELGVTENI